MPSSRSSRPPAEAGTPGNSLSSFLTSQGEVPPSLALFFFRDTYPNEAVSPPNEAVSPPGNPTPAIGQRILLKDTFTEWCAS